jgi:peptidoglycan/xylan/chitin deacetylase (PgdA/CDA1 family)
MTVGSHGMRHRPWRELDEPALEEELVDARRILEDVVERPVTEAACPFGSYDRRVLGALRRGSYRHVYTSDRGPARRGDWLQARNTITARDGDEQLRRILTERDGLLRRAKLTAKRWR